MRSSDAVIRYHFLPVVTTHRTLSDNKSLIILMRFYLGSFSFPFLIILRFIIVDRQNILFVCSPQHLSKHWRNKFLDASQFTRLFFCYFIVFPFAKTSDLLGKEISQNTQKKNWNHKKMILSGAHTALFFSAQANENQSQVQMLGQFHDTSVLYQISPLHRHRFENILFRSRVFRDGYMVEKRHRSKRADTTQPSERYSVSFRSLQRHRGSVWSHISRKVI